MDKHYTIRYSCFNTPIAEAYGLEGWKQAIADKEQQPSLIYSVAHRIGRAGVLLGSLAWINGAWH